MTKENDKNEEIRYFWFEKSYDQWNINLFVLCIHVFYVVELLKIKFEEVTNQ